MKIRSLLFALLLGLTSKGMAQPVGNAILQDLEIEAIEECLAVEISFSIPFRYLAHYPAKKGKELRVQLLPLSASQDFGNSLPNNETLRIQNKALSLMIKDISYEKDNLSGRPFLVIQFETDTYYTVHAGDKFRSVHLIISHRDDRCLQKAR